MSVQRGYRSINIKKVFHYFTLVLLAIVMIMPAAILTTATSVEAAWGYITTPHLITPANGTITNDNTPWFSAYGANVIGGYYDYPNNPDTASLWYHFQVDNNSDFSSPVLDDFEWWLPIPPLADGKYYFRVRASGTVHDEYYHAIYGSSDWSETWSFTVDTTPPPVPVLSSPANGSSTADTTPALKWNAVSDATSVSYEWQIANNASFSSVYSHGTTTATSYTFSSPLPNDIYCWRVRAIDAAGNASAWSTGWNVYITPIPTTLTVARVEGYYGSTVNLTATLKTANSGTPVAGKTIHFSLNGTNLGIATTDASGVANKSAGLKTYLPGSYNVGVQVLFAGDATFGGSLGTAALHVLPIQTALTLNPVSGTYGGTATLIASLKTTDGTPIPGYSINFSVNGTGVGNVITDANGTAILQSVSLSGIPAGTYPVGIGASFAGNIIYSASGATAQLIISNAVPPPQEPPPLQPGYAATGSGWYTFAGTGRINFSFNVNQVPKTAKPVVYKGEINLINDGKWRLKGKLDTCYVFDPYGSADGSGQLYIWNSVMDNGKGGWELVKDNVKFTIHFGDLNAGGGTGQNKGIVSPEQFGINIDYVAPAGAPPLPNSNPTDLQGGNIDIKKDTKS